MINECARKKKLKSRNFTVSEFFLLDIEQLTFLIIFLNRVLKFLSMILYQNGKFVWKYRETKTDFKMNEYKLSSYHGKDWKSYV